MTTKINISGGNLDPRAYEEIMRHATDGTAHVTLTDVTVDGAKIPDAYPARPIEEGDHVHARESPYIHTVRSIAKGYAATTYVNSIGDAHYSVYPLTDLSHSPFRQ